MKKIAAALLGAGLMLGAAPAFAGEWRLDARRCADMREDWRDARENRRDERYDRGRRDVREDRHDRREDHRDRAITVCPRNAFYYVASRGERLSKRRAPRLALSYDRRLHMYYRYDRGRRIYVRG
jgi:hypothetical protein